MIKRTVEISTDGCYVHTKHSQLVIEKDGEKIGSVPIEDLGVLIIDSHQITLSSSLFANLAAENVAVVFTDFKHLPISLAVPFTSNTIQSKILAQQIQVSVPQKKRLWSAIISAKILNQSKSLAHCGKDGTSLREISKNIPSGDPKNLEAFAARIYWRKLFGDEFRRNRENMDANALLNYGYAIVRAAAARAIVGTGLHPSFGVHHKNQYNPFPLADDLVEPLRPFIDVKVFSIVQETLAETDEDDLIFELNRELKGKLLGILANDCILDNRKQPLLNAIGLYAASVKQFMFGEGKNLIIPTL
ncbi:type II CRISPR-associated endonuclease Cas1 [soil metagenome]